MDTRNLFFGGLESCVLAQQKKGHSISRIALAVIGRTPNIVIA